MSIEKGEITRIELSIANTFLRVKQLMEEKDLNVHEASIAVEVEMEMRKTESWPLTQYISAKYPNWDKRLN